MAVSNPKQPGILDSIVNGSYDPLGVGTNVPAPLLPALSSTPDASAAPPALKGPTLGTQAQFTAPSDNAQPGPAAEGNWSADRSTLTLPPRTADNSSEPAAMASEEHPGFLKTLARVAGGAMGFSDPDSSPQAALGAKIGNLVGRVGNAMAEASGTPEQRELANERSILPLKVAQLQATLGINQQNANSRALTAQTGAKTEQDKYAAGDAAMGLPPGTSRMTAMAAQESAAVKEQLAKIKLAQMNGKTHVTPEAANAVGQPELADKDLTSLEYLQRITNPLKNQLAAGGGTKTVDLGADGVFGYSALTRQITRLGDSPSVARANSMLLRTQFPVNDAQGNTLGWVNPQTNSYTPVSAINAKGGNGPSLATAEGGSVIPPKPTNSILTQGQMASNIIPEITRIKQEVLALGDKVGAAGGRWNDFWVNKGGINDPDYAKTDQDLTFLSSAMAKAHFGGSPPEGIADGLKKNFSMAQSPEDLNARMDSADAWMSGYASRVGGTKSAPKPGPNTSTKLTPAQYLAQKKAGK